MLALPDFTQEFVIECDALGRGLGAVLMQLGRPVAFYSKTLSPSNLSKFIYEKELMVVALAIQHWRHYFLGRKFVVFIDQESKAFATTVCGFCRSAKQVVKAVGV